MKRAIVLLLLLLFCQMAPAQTYLEKLAEWNGVEINLPEGVTASQNAEPFFLYPVTESNPYPTMAQSYNFERCRGKVFFNAFFSMVSSVLECKSNDYIVIPVLLEHRRISGQSPEAHDSDEDELISNCSGGMDFGSNVKFPEKYEIDQLKRMVKIYSGKTAKKYSNATGMVSFPLSLQHNVLYDKYTHCKVVMVRNKKTDTTFSLIFLMTDENYTRFDEFLKDFKGAFRFKDAPVTTTGSFRQ